MDLEQPIITNAKYISGSDHQIITTTWHTDILSQEHKKKRNKKRKRKIYQFSKMTREEWDSFTEELNKRFKEKTLDKRLTNQKELNSAWSFWSIEIKTMINRKIPFIFTNPKQYFALSLRATKLHIALKTMNKLLHKITQKENTPLEVLNKMIRKILKLTDISIAEITETFIHEQQLEETICSLKDIKNTIWVSRNQEK